MPEVNPDWWKTLFDETYLVTDARSVCDDGLTCREVDFLQDFLRLEKSWPILDLCGGQGRHSLELSRRGFRNVTVLDYSEFLIELGMQKAQKEGLNTRFIKRDARDTCLPSGNFRVIIVMASSFGYFVEEIQNEKILREAFRLLMPGGLLFLDLPNRDYVVNQFKSRSWHEANEEILVCRERRLHHEDVIYSREMVISKAKGLIRDATYCTRLYTPEKITEMLNSAGFDKVQIQKEFVMHEQKLDYGLMSNRMITLGHRR